MESQAKGCEIIVSGKLRGQRAKSMKFVDGVMIHSGDPVNDYIQQAVRHVKLRQGMLLLLFTRSKRKTQNSSLGVLGIKVKIMLPHDPDGKIGPRQPPPDHIEIREPRDELNPTVPYSEPKNAEKEQQPPTATQQPIQQQPQQQPQQQQQQPPAAF